MHVGCARRAGFSPDQPRAKCLDVRPVVGCASGGRPCGRSPVGFDVSEDLSWCPGVGPTVGIRLSRPFCANPTERDRFKPLNILILGRGRMGHPSKAAPVVEVTPWCSGGVEELAEGNLRRTSPSISRCLNRRPTCSRRAGNGGFCSSVAPLAGPMRDAGSGRHTGSGARCRLGAQLLGWGAPVPQGVGPGGADDAGP